MDFKVIKPAEKADYDAFLLNSGERGCEYNLANLFIWGRQHGAFYENALAFFSHFRRSSVYLFPLFRGDPRPMLDAVIADARQRGITCRLTSLLPEDCTLLEQLYPGQFRFHNDRDGYDYIYDIQDLAELKGRKYQRKRNHLHRFQETYAGYCVEPVTDENTPEIRVMLDGWYEAYQEKNPDADIYMEEIAIDRALRYRESLDLEGIILRHEGKILAMTMGSPLAANSFDIHFEKAAEESAYVAINYEFSRYLREKYPNLLWINREDDLGLEGLRKAKLSYHPHHMIEKKWACFTEDECED